MRRPPASTRALVSLQRLDAATGGNNTPWYVAMRTAPSGPAARPRPLAELSLEDAAQVRGGNAGLGTGLLLAD